MQLITKSEELQEFCEHIWQSREASENFITVDTEFQRERTYYPQLCLVQIATHERIGLIDALGDSLDLTPLWQIFAAQEITKVFHAARQDIEIFYLLNQQIPTPLFDTQIAAMVCGFGESVGYDTLVQHYLQKTVDKSLQRTNWKQRPLSQRQLQYAANDVLYLRDIYQAMQAYLDQSQRHTWYADEMQTLIKPETYYIDEDQVWRRLKINNDLKYKGNNDEFLARLQALARLREQWARQYDLPRAHVLPDDLLIDLATLCSTTSQSMPNYFKRCRDYITADQMEQIIHILDTTIVMPSESWLSLPRTEPLFEISPQLIKLLEFFLKLRAEQLQIVPRLIASRSELPSFVHKKDLASSRFLTGWRYEVFGKDALALLNGKAVLNVDSSKVIVTPLNEDIKQQEIKENI